MHSYHKARRIHGAVAFCLVLSRAFVHAQNTTAPEEIPTCISPWNLLNNDGATPCETLFKVMSDCDSSKRFTLPSVESEPLGMYGAPNAGNSALERCQCTQVGYNLYSACAACQVGDNPTRWLDHTKWFASCNIGAAQTPTRPPSAANEILAGWIMQDYGAKFSVNSALSVATGGPVLSVAAATSSALSPNASAGGSSGSGAVSPDNAMSSASSNSPNTTPIIAGAVAGAVALLAILGIAFFCVRRRQKRRTAPSAEFMKYAQANTASAREPLRSQSRANTGDDEHGNVYIGNRQSYPHHGIRLDSPVPGGGPSGEESGDVMEMSEGGLNPPAFTPGLFKDPIFEKGVALNLAAANMGGAAYGGSPVTYSPATPSSTVHHASGGGTGGNGSERQALIQGHTRQGTLE